MSSTTHGAPPDLEARAVAIAYHQVAPALALVALVPLPLAVLLRETAGVGALALWALGQWVIAGVRWIGIRRYRLDPARDARSAYWSRWFVIGASASGFGWSALGTVLYPPTEVWTRTLIGMAISAISATGLVTLGAIPAAYRGFILCLLGPIGLYHVASGGTERVAIGLSAFVFAGVLAAMSRRVSDNVRNVLRATAESAELARRLADAMEDAVRKNQALEHEIGERERAQEQTEHSDARLRLAVESAGVSTWEIDVRTGRLTITGGPRGDTGLVEAAAAGVPVFLESVHPDDRASVERVLASVQHEGAVLRTEFRVRHEGEWRWLAALGRFLPGTDGGRIIGVSQDVTRRKSVLAELDAARLRAESASRAKSQFLANMSHEIRTPLNGVVGMLELLAASELGTAQREMATAATRSSEALLGVINNVLDLSKIEADRMELEAVAFDPTALATDVAALLAESAARKGLRLDCRIEPGLPCILGDPTRLRQVLINLVANAVKFTEHGEVALELTRETHRDDDQVRLRFRVVDTGIGMPPEVLDRLFRPFSQADMSTSRRYGGTGLGLAISRQLVGLMGGEIGVTSAPGEGSAFAFALSFPRSSVAAVQAAAGSTRGSAVATTGGAPSTGALAGLPVLVVEDNAVNRQVVHAMLTRLGCRVELAVGGADGIQAALSQPWGAILMDCQMPDIDGFEATRRIRAAEGMEQHTPIIALTANALQGDRERCLAAGMDDYLAKPFTAAALHDVLRRALGPAAPAPAAEEVLLPAALEDARAIDPDGSLLATVAGIFYADAARLLSEARAAAARGDLEGFIFAVHTLKSCSGSVGAARVTAAATAMEHAARLAGTLPEPAAFDRLAHDYDDACDALARVTGTARPLAQASA